MGTRFGFITPGEARKRNHKLFLVNINGELAHNVVALNDIEGWIETLVITDGKPEVDPETRTFKTQRSYGDITYLPSGIENIKSKIESVSVIESENKRSIATVRDKSTVSKHLYIPLELEEIRLLQLDSSKQYVLRVELVKEVIKEEIMTPGPIVISPGNSGNNNSTPALVNNALATGVKGK